MSQVIENKVVEMQFDNSNFEKNVKQSMDSLNQLNDTLDNVGADSNAFSGITDALNGLTATVGKINPLRWSIWEDIYNAAKGVGVRLVGAIMTPIQMASSGGWNRALNIEQAKFQLEGAGQDVEKAFNSAMKAVDSTAYSLDAAARVASQLAGSGMEAGDEMTKALTAVSGVAAQTMASYEEIGDIFVDINSAGRVTGDSLNRLAMRGLNARAELAKALGKSEADIAKMVSKGQISFKQFSDAMYDAFGEHAYKANETYTGSLSNLHSALNKIGADFNQYKIKDMVTLFNSLRKMVNKVRVELTPISEIYGKIHAIGVKLLSDFIDKLDFKWLTPVFDGLANIFMQIIKLASAVGDAIRSMFPDDFGTTIQNFAERFRDFTENISISNETLDKIQTIVKGIISFFDIIFTIIKQVISGLFSIGSSFGGLGDIILTVLAKVSDVLIWFDNWIKSTNIITNTIETIKNALIVVGVVIVGLALKVKELFDQFIQNEHVVNIINTIVEAFNKLKNGIKSLFTISPNTGNGKESDGIFGGLSSKLKSFREICEKIIHDFPVMTLVVTTLAIAIGVAATNFGQASKRFGKAVSFFANPVAALKDSFKKSIGIQTKIPNLMAFIGFIAALVAAMAALAHQPLSGIVAALASIEIVIFSLWKIIKEVNFMAQYQNQREAFTMLVKLAGNLALIGAALALAARHPWYQLLSAGAAMAGVIALLIPLIKIMSRVRVSKYQVTTIRRLVIPLIAAIGVIGVTLAIAAKNNWGQLAAAAGGISLCLMALAAVVAILDKLDVKTIDISIIGTIVALSVGIGLIGKALKNASQHDWLNILVAAGGISATMLAMSGVIAILANIKDAEKAIVGAAAMAIASISMIPIAKAIEQLVSYDWSQMWPGIAAMGITIGVLAIALAALTALGTGTGGIGAAVILAAAAAIWICGEAVLSIGQACIMAAEALEHLAQAFVVLSHDVDFEVLITGGNEVINFLKEFDEWAWTAIKGAIALAVGGNGFKKFAEGLQSLAKVDITSVSDNIVKIFNAVGEGLSQLQGWGVELELFAHSFAVFAEVLKGFAIASIALGAGLVLAGIGFLAVGGGLKLMIDPLERMQNLNWPTLSEGLIVLTKVFKKFAYAATFLASFSSGLIEAAIAMGLLAIECYAFGNFDLQKIADGLMMLASSGSLLGLAGIVMLAGSIGVGLMAASVAALSIAVGVASLVISNGIDTILIAVEKLSNLKDVGKNAVQGFVNGITSSLSKVVKSGISLASSFYESIVKFLGIASPSKILRTVGNFTGSGFILGVADMMDEAEKSGKGLSLSALAGVSGAEDLFKAAGISSGGAYAGGFMSIIDSFFNSGDISRTGANGMPSDIAAKMSKTGTKGLNGLLDQFTGKLFDTAEIENKVKEASQGAAGGLDSLGDSASKAGKKTSQAKDELASFYDKIESSISIFDEFKKEDPMDPTKLLQNMKSQIDGMVGWSTQIQQLATKGIDQGLLKKLADMGPSSYKYTQAFVNMTAEQLAEANKYFEQSLMLPQHVTAQIYGSYEIAGMNAGEGFIGGLNKEDVKSEGVKFAYSFLDSLRSTLGIHSPSKETEKDGRNVTSGMINGITWPTMLFNLENATARMCLRITDTIDKKLKSEEFITIGKNVVSGIQKGIEDQGTQSSLFDKVKSLCQRVIDTAKSPQGFNEHSPSVVFEQIGRYVVEGLVMGISSNTDMATSAMKDLANSTINNMRNIVNTVQKIASDDIDVEPVIRPILDIESLTDGLGSISSMMNDSLTPSITLNNQNPIDYISQANLVNNNSDVVAAVESLKEDVAFLGDAMTNIKMVLDTGTMVGAMTPAIDQQLGMRQVLAGRGI